jgi:hypothetical protein
MADDFQTLRSPPSSMPTSSKALAFRVPKLHYRPHLPWWVWAMIGMAALLCMLVCGILVGIIPSSRSVPVSVTVEAIETTYPDLIARLTQVAREGGVSAPQTKGDTKLVAPTEILKAKVGRNGGYLIIGGKSLGYQSRIFVLPRVPHIGHPVLNKYWDTMQDGREVTVVSYEARVLNSSGQEMTVIIDFDLGGLERRLKGE